jgi:hypothetical protein
MKKILHVSYHSGCVGDINYVGSKLNIDVNVLRANWDYLITHNRAKEVWDKNKDYFNSFDLIITSDTAPLSRIFLQNGYKGKLIVWICNRFDYPNRDGFPDSEYFYLWNSSLNSKKVQFISYTPFEYIYARQRGINLSDFVIKPIAGSAYIKSNNHLKETNKKDRFFIPPYHNDSIYMNLKDKCNSLGLECFAGRYNGPFDLKTYKAVIHIPYAWSNLALFEAFYLGLPYLIPSYDFLIKLSTGHNFFWSPPFQAINLKYAEWYCDEFKDLLIYFDSWEDLKDKANNINFNVVRERIRAFHEVYEKKELLKWEGIFN